MQLRNWTVLMCGVVVWVILFSMINLNTKEVKKHVKAVPCDDVPHEIKDEDVWDLSLSPEESKMLRVLRIPSYNVSEDFVAPCLIHRTSKNADAIEALSSFDYSYFVKPWRQLAHPLCNTVLWHDAAGTELVRKYEPDLLPEYLWLATGTERGDVARLVAIYYFGGIYADLDLAALRDPAVWTFGNKRVGAIFAMEYCKNNTQYHKQDYGVMQYAFAAAPGHPIIRRALDTFKELVYQERTTGDVYYKDYGYNAQIMRRTGPVLLSNAVKYELQKRGLTWRNPCQNDDKPYMVPDSDILILPLHAYNAYHGVADPYGVTKHYFKSNWVSGDPNAWYVPQ